MNRLMTVYQIPGRVPVAQVHLYDDFCVALNTNLNNNHTRFDQFLAACDASAERLYTAIKELLIQMVAHSENLIWEEC